MPSFALHDLDGRPVRARKLRGRAALVTFFDSHGREACPLIAAKLAVALDSLSPSERRQLVPLALSMNPRDDTPASARSFMRRHRLLGRMRYLVGSVAELRPVWKRFHVLSSLDSGDADVHSAAVRIYDRAGRWVASFNEGVDLTPQNLAHDVRLALGEG
jgi:protein SCO1/2